MTVFHCGVESQTSVVYYDIHWTQCVICARHEIKNLVIVHNVQFVSLHYIFANGRISVMHSTYKAAVAARVGKSRLLPGKNQSISKELCVLEHTGGCPMLPWER